MHRALVATASAFSHGASGRSGPVTSVGGAALDPQVDPLRSDSHQRELRPLDTLAAQLVASGRGEVVAFTDLYDGLAPRIYRLVLRTVGDTHQAEEVTQEVFLQIWQNSDRFDPRRGNARSWVMTMAHRRAVDRVRTSEARRRRDDKDADLGRQDPIDPTSEAAHASLDAEKVRAGLATLSHVQRRALELAYFGGYTHSEVAQLLKIPLGTAKTRIRDGLIQLRDVLSSSMNDPAGALIASTGRCSP